MARVSTLIDRLHDFAASVSLNEMAAIKVCLLADAAQVTHVRTSARMRTSR